MKNEILIHWLEQSDIIFNNYMALHKLTQQAEYSKLIFVQHWITILIQLAIIFNYYEDE